MWLGANQTINIPDPTKVYNASRHLPREPTDSLAQAWEEPQARAARRRQERRRLEQWLAARPRPRCGAADIGTSTRRHRRTPRTLRTDSTWCGDGDDCTSRLGRGSTAPRATQGSRPSQHAMERQPSYDATMRRIEQVRTIDVRSQRWNHHTTAHKASHTRYSWVLVGERGSERARD